MKKTEPKKTRVFRTLLHLRPPVDGAEKEDRKPSAAKERKKKMPFFFGR